MKKLQNLLVAFLLISTSTLFSTPIDDPDKNYDPRLFQVADDEYLQFAEILGEFLAASPSVYDGAIYTCAECYVNCNETIEFLNSFLEQHRPHLVEQFLANYHNVVKANLIPRDPNQFTMPDDYNYCSHENRPSLCTKITPSRFGYVLDLLNDYRERHHSLFILFPHNSWSCKIGNAVHKRSQTLYKCN